MPISLSEGNEKLNKPNGGYYKILGFGIPARATCPGALDCIGVCYALQGRYRTPNVTASREANYQATLSPSFVDDMVALLNKRRTYNVVRIHDSGDFYSLEYYGKWCDIARRVPGKIFYAYTKSLHLDLETNRPDNLRIIQSLGGKYDCHVDMSRPHSRIFSTDDARIAAGYVDGNVNDVPAIEGTVNIGLVYHGVRKLTLAQVKHFS